MIRILFIIIPGLFTVPKELNAQRDKVIKVSIELNREWATDSFHLVVYENPIDTRYIPTTIKSATINYNDNIHFELEGVKKPVFLSLFKGRVAQNRPKFIFNLYLAEPGDQISIKVEKVKKEKKFQNKEAENILHFTGKGASKYKCRFEIDKAISEAKGGYKVIDSFGHFLRNTRFDSQQLIVKKILKSYKSAMSKIAFNVLSVDYFAAIETDRLNQIWMTFGLGKSVLEKSKLEYSTMVESVEKQFTEEAKILSPNYFQFVVDIELIGRSKNSSRRINKTLISEAFQQIKNNYKGELRDKALTFFLIIQGWSPVLEPLVEDAVETVNTDYCLEELDRFIAQNAHGKPAYNFSLQDSTGRTVKLTDFENKIVFVDFWFNGCGACSQYFIRVLSKTEEHFRDNAEVVFIAVSTDASKEKWLDGIYSGKYTTQHIINLYTGGAGIDHPVIKYYKVNSFPRPILIDRHSKILSNDIGELKSGGPDKLIETINRALKSK